MALSIVRDSGAGRMAEVLEFRTQGAAGGNLFARAARDQYLEGHAERMERIRRLALAQLEREERENAGRGTS